MSVSVILIAYNGDKWLPDCLETLSKASRERLHLVLVDNAHNTIIDELDLSPYDAEVISTPHSMGFAEANNWALTNASHLEDRVLFLNQDTMSPEGWIDRCERELLRNEGLGAVSPLIRTYDDEGWDPNFTACLSEDQKSALGHEDDRRVFVTRELPAPAMLIRTDVLLTVGPFDPVFESYYEDYDLCRRIREAGYTVGFCGHARVRHFSGSATDNHIRVHRRMRQVIRNRIIMKLRESDAPRWKDILRLVLVEFPHRLLRGIAGTPSSQPPRVTLRAFGDLAGLFRRLVSDEYDRACWNLYLEEIEWPPRRSRERSKVHAT